MRRTLSLCELVLPRINAEPLKFNPARGFSIYMVAGLYRLDFKSEEGYQRAWWLHCDQSCWLDEPRGFQTPRLPRFRTIRKNLPVYFRSPGPEDLDETQRSWSSSVWIFFPTP